MKKWLLWLLCLALLAPAALAEGGSPAGTSRTLTLNHPQFQVDGKPALDLNGLSITYSRLNDSVYLRLDGGDARLALGGGLRDGQILAFMDGLEGLYALNADAALASLPGAADSLADGNAWREVLEAWRGVAAADGTQGAPREVLWQGQPREMDAWPFALDGAEALALLPNFAGMPGDWQGEVTGTLYLAGEDFRLELTPVESGVDVNIEGTLTPELLTLEATAAQEGEPLAHLTLTADSRGSTHLELEAVDVQASFTASDAGGLRVTRLEMAALGFAVQSTSRRDGDEAHWRTVVEGQDGSESFHLEATYQARVERTPEKTLRETGTMTLALGEGVTASFDVVALESAVPPEASFLDALDAAPAVDIAALTAAEQTALAARVQSRWLKFGAGAIQSVPGITSFATMLAEETAEKENFSSDAP